MKTFDYARAWHDLAVPTFNALPAALRLLWADFQQADRGILSEREEKGRRIVVPRMTQGPDLDTMGCPPDLRARFDTFSTGDLARASRAICYCGHWDPGILGGNLTGKFDKYGTGAAWKFANICDQVLRWRIFGTVDELGREVARPMKERRACTIIEGMMRETFQDRHSWTWFGVCFASEDYMTNRPRRPSLKGGRWKAYDWRELEAFGASCKAGEFATEDARPWLDLERFRIEDKGYQGFAKRDKFAAHAEAREARKWAARGVVTV